MRLQDERGQGQRYRLGDALYRQIAFDGNGLVAFKAHLGRLERRGREFLGTQEILALDVAVEDVEAGIDRLGVDDDVDRAGLRFAVEHDLAARLVKAAQLGRETEVAVGKAREGVRAVNDEGFRRGECGTAEGGKYGSKGEAGFCCSWRCS